MAKHTTNPAEVIVNEEGNWSCTITDMSLGIQEIQMKEDGASVPGPAGTRVFTVDMITYVGAGAFQSIMVDGAGTEIAAPEGAATGDFLLLVLAVTSAFVDADSGAWTSASTSNDVFWRIRPSGTYNSAAITTYNDGDSGQYQLSGIMYAFHNVHATSPFDAKDASPVSQSNTTVWTGSTQGSISTSSMPIMIGMSPSLNLSTNTITPSGSIDVVVKAGAINPVSSAVLGYDSHADGATEAPTLTFNAARSGYKWTAALRKA